MEFRSIIRRAAAYCGAGALLGAAIPAQALDFQFDELDISIETAVSAPTGVRTSSRDSNLVGKANNLDTGVNAVNTDRGVFSVNGDDGNLNYDKWDFFFSRVGIISDITIQQGDFGVFLRPSYLWDPRLDNDDFADPGDYGAGRTRSFADLRRKNEEVTNEVADNAELYDAYFFGRFEVFDRNVAFKIGKQVLNWGESTFVQNGINSIIAANANRAYPGAEVKEIFIPTSMAWFSFDITRNIAFEGFWQLEHESSIPRATGTFFSTNDLLTPGGQDAQLSFGRCDENLPSVFAVPPGSANCGATGGTFPRAAADEPDDYNQYGGRLSFYIPQLNNMELSLYAMRYNSRLPTFAGRTVSEGRVAPLPGVVTPGIPCTPGNFACIGQGTSGNYQLVYPEGIDLYGISFNTYSDFLGVALQGEYSVKKDQPLNIAGPELIMFALGLDDAFGPLVSSDGCITSVCRSGHGSFEPDTYFEGYQRFDVHQADFSFTKVMGPGDFINVLGANQMVLVGEFAATYVEDLPSTGDLPFGGSGDFAPNLTEAANAVSMPAQDRRAYGDEMSWGYRLAGSMRYNNVFNIVNVVPSLRFFHDVDGTTPSPIGNFTEESKLLAFNVTVEYLSNLEFGGGYTVFWGGEHSTLSQTPTCGLDTGLTVPCQREKGELTNNFNEDRDFANLFVRYTF